MSSQGGVNIEEIAAENPDAIIYSPIDFVKGINKIEVEKIAQKIGLDGQKDQVVDMVDKMYKLFIKRDALLIEINPYAEDTNGLCK